MKETLKKYPLPISGLILGLSSLGNLVQSYSEVFRNILGMIAGILILLFIAKLIIYPRQVKEELNNPVIASVFPTFSMAIMILSTYLKPYFPTFAIVMWMIGLGLHFILIVWFTLKFICKFKIKQVFPSWFIVYVGIVVASVTGSAYRMVYLGKLSFWFGFISYFILLFIVLFRLIKVREMPEPTLPTFAILAAPASLLLSGYMNSFTEKNTFMVYLLMSLSFIFYVTVLTMLPKLLRLKFYPSYSGFTFPLIISAIGMKLSNGFLLNMNKPVPLLKYLVVLQVLVATSITLYVLIKYIMFLKPKKLKEKSVLQL